MNCDTASARINKPANIVFDFMADTKKLDLWSFGTWDIEIQEDGLIHGKSIFNGSSIFVRVMPHRQQRLIDYQIGISATCLASRIFARVIPGQDFAADENTSLLLLTAIRSDDMDEERWQGLKASHAFEVGLIKSLIESGYDHRA